MRSSGFKVTHSLSIARGTRSVCCSGFVRPGRSSNIRSCRLQSFSMQRQRLVCRGSSGDEFQELQPSKLGPNVAAGVKEVRKNLQWYSATVVKNESASADGHARALHLSISDHVDLLYGRKVKGVQDAFRWIDSYTMPGQSVAIRLPNQTVGEPTERLHSIISSPYESKRDSAYLDASLIEVAVDRNGDADEKRLAELAPGETLEVSQVVGRGFSSLLNSYIGIPHALEEGRNLLLIGVGLKGMAPLRAAINWTPVQAHATAHKVVCMYVADAPTTAAFLPEWDTWKEAGVVFEPLYLRNDKVEALSGTEVLDKLDWAVFGRPGAFEGLVGGRAHDCVVLMAGVAGLECEKGKLAAELTSMLARRGVVRERVLFCDFF